MSQTTKTIGIDGMSCVNSCARRVSKELEKVEGLQIEDVALGSARLRYDPNETSEDDIAQAVEDAGFTPVMQPA